MSFDVYLQSFHNGEPAGIPRQRVREAFGAHLAEIEQDQPVIVTSGREIQKEILNGAR